MSVWLSSIGILVMISSFNGWVLAHKRLCIDVPKVYASVRLTPVAGNGCHMICALSERGEYLEQMVQPSVATSSGAAVLPGQLPVE